MRARDAYNLTFDALMAESEPLQAHVLRHPFTLVSVNPHDSPALPAGEPIINHCGFSLMRTLVWG